MTEEAIEGVALASSSFDDLVRTLFMAESASLVRMARLFVDDRDAAEDLVQEAFIRLARTATRIREPERATAYLRSIVLNLARDHNRRGLVSLRHRPSALPEPPTVEEQVSGREESDHLLEALRALASRQRDAVALRYFLELSVPDVAATMGVSVNSAKTHLKRGLRALEQRLEADR